MIQQYDYNKMETLTNELLAVLMNANFDAETLSLFIDKVNSSETYFNGMAANAFRSAAQQAVSSFSMDNVQSILKLVNVAQTPRNNAEAMKVIDKVAATKIQNTFKTK